MSTHSDNQNNSTLYGHPKGLFYLAFTEAWERFSYYGMTAILVLYMVNQLLLPGHIENIVGFETLRGVLESATGPLSTVGLASMIFGLYSGFVYFTPVFGGIIADRWIGQRNAVIIGALCMTAGHIFMAFDQSFLLALLMLIIGSGFLKGNISAQVGALYPVEDEARRTRGFAIFSTAINIGAVLGPLTCGYLAQDYGWHYGFGVAAIFMVGGLLTYLYGYRYLPSKVVHEGEHRSRMNSGEWKVIIALLCVIGISVFQSISYYQSLNILKVWLQDHVDLTVGGFTIPVAWYQSLDAAASIVAVPTLFMLWKWQAKRNKEPNDLGKIGIGALMVAFAYFLLFIGIYFTGEKLSSPWLPFITVVLLGYAFIYQWPTLLALVSGNAPARINSTMVGITFISLFIAGNSVGWLGSFYDKMTPGSFWLLQAGVSLIGAVLIVLFGPRLRKVLKSK